MALTRYALYSESLRDFINCEDTASQHGLAAIEPSLALGSGLEALVSPKVLGWIY